MLRRAEVIELGVEHEYGKYTFIHSKNQLIDAGKVLPFEYFELINCHELVGLIYAFIHFGGIFFCAFFVLRFFFGRKLNVMLLERLLLLFLLLYEIAKTFG